MDRYGDSSGGCWEELTSLAEAEKARFWAAPVNALRAANMMLYGIYWTEGRCRKIAFESSRTDGGPFAEKSGALELRDFSFLRDPSSAVRKVGQALGLPCT
jgi:hypothetical protein